MVRKRMRTFFVLNNDLKNVDVVMGDNSCSELFWQCCAAGFPATVGYDAVSGLGSINLEALIQYGI
jgi:hypothetical protein